MGYPIEARGDRSSGDECGPDEHFSTCAWRPRIHEALTAVCREATATDGRALLAFIARPSGLEPDGDRQDDLASLACLRRDDDVMDVCPAGVVLVVGGFTHPAQCETVVERAVARLGWGEGTAVGLAVFPTHADRVTELVASASASLRRALSTQRPATIAAPLRDRVPSGALRQWTGRVVQTLTSPRLSLVRPAGDASRPLSRPA